MKKFLLSVVIIVTISAQSFAQKAPKYVFYFIGDGMGVNVVHLTETYLAALNGNLGIEPLAFTQFPVVSFGTTFSADDDVTDSAASGTALATGFKTNNAAIGLDPQGNRLTSIAEKAKRSGKKVGIVTSVGINHATPAAFYAHQPDRGMFYKIAQDMIPAGFDFYAGSSIEHNSKLEDGTKVRSFSEIIEENGYSYVRGMDEFNQSFDSAEKMLMVSARKKGIIYGIDRKGLNQDGLTLMDLTDAAMRFLQKDNKKGFFLMIEGGSIDGAEHGHDAAAAIHEVLDFNESIKMALEFYKEHPKETLIIVTADHETGGVTFDPNPAQLAMLANQKLSQERTSSILKKLVKEREPEILSWEETKAFLTEYFGLWDKVPVSWDQEKYLHDTYEYTIARKDPGHQVDLYADNAILIARAVLVLNTNAHVFWGTESHSAGPVPTFAIGTGAERFSGRMDNTLIPQLIEQIAQYR